jgi:DNA-binding NtrC family response regulator
MACLEAYAWPGNVRELEHAIERAVAVSAHPILLPDDLPLHLSPTAPSPAQKSVGASGEFLPLDEMTRQHLARVLKSTGGNKKRAAEILGVDRRTLYRMLERYATPGADLSPEA